VTERARFLYLLFETFSAFSTAGLSTGLTRDLSPTGRLILVVTMFAGPLGNRIRSSTRFRRVQRTATGGIMIGLGAYLAVSRSE